DEGSGRIQEMIRRTKEKIEAQNEKIRQAVLKKHGVKTAAELPEGALADALRKKEQLSPEELARNAAYSKRLEIYNRAVARYQPLVFAVGDSQDSSPETFILTGGNLKSPGEKVAPGVLSYAAFRPASVPGSAADRRLALARWIASPENPLTARVMVNRIWQHHFATSLVATPDNLGRSGAKPSHPELLDYLAAEFVSSGWSVKAMHRLILNSAVYRQ